jgi:hypothetical protein
MSTMPNQTLLENSRIPPPKWAVLAAWAVPLCVLPSAVWRLALAMNMFEGEAPAVGHSLAERIYVPLLSFASVGLGVLTLGLVQRWGEVVPRWVPGIGGHRVPTKAAAIPAAAGATAVTLVCLYAVLNGHFHWVTHVRPLIGEERTGPGITGTALKLGTWAYSPLILWGPLLLAVTISYYRRRKAQARLVAVEVAGSLGRVHSA